MALLPRPVMMMIWSQPAAMASSTPYWMMGLSTRGSISLGWALVAGRKRVPRPAAGKTALRTVRTRRRSGGTRRSCSGVITILIVNDGNSSPPGEDECQTWTIPANARAQNGAGAIHSDLEKHFIRAETIRWDQLLEAGSEANAITT